MLGFEDKYNKKVERCEYVRALSWARKDEQRRVVPFIRQKQPDNGSLVEEKAFRLRHIFVCVFEEPFHGTLRQMHGARAFLLLTELRSDGLNECTKPEKRVIAE